MCWRISIPRLICICVPNLVPIDPAVWSFPRLLWPSKPHRNSPWCIEGQIAFRLCPFLYESAKFDANRASLLIDSQDFWTWDPLKPHEMPPGVLRSKLYLAYVHSQTNPQTWTIWVGANRSSRLTAFPDVWYFDHLKPSMGNFFGVSIPIWICTGVPNLVPIGPAVW